LLLILKCVQELEVLLQVMHPVFILILETSLKRISDVIEKITDNIIKYTALLFQKHRIGHDPEPLSFN